MESFENNVYHPSHYNKDGRRECWDEMIDIFGIDAVIDFDFLSAYKYFYRAGLKDGNPAEQDIAKIKNYVNHAKMLIDRNSDDYKLNSPKSQKTENRLMKLYNLLSVLKEGGIDIE